MFVSFIFFLFFIFLPVLGDHVSELLQSFFNNFNLSLDALYFNGEVEGLVQVPRAKAQKGRRNN